MIEGASDITRLMGVLNKLGVISTTMDVTEGATYAIAYTGHTMRMEESSEYILEEVSDEELDVMMMCDEGYASWYADKILLEEEDE